MDVVDLSYEPMVYLDATDTLDCITETVILDGTGSQTGNPIIYQWFDAQNNQIPGASSLTMEVDNAEMFTLVVVDTATACSSSASVWVNEDYDYPDVDAGTDQHLDCIVLNVDLDGSNSAQGNHISYQWECTDGNIISGSATTLATVNEPGLYYFTVLNTDNGCADTDSVLVTQDITLPYADAGEDQEIDCHSSSVQLSGNASAIGGQFEIGWTLGNNPAIVGNTLQLTVETAGTYTLHVTNLLNGCESEDQAIVFQGTAAPSGVDILPESPTCAGDTDGSVVLSEVYGGEGPYLYSLNGGDFQQASIYNNLPAGPYNILIQDINECTYETDFVLEDGNELLLDLGEDQSISLGQIVDLYAIINIPEEEVQQFTWHPDTTITCDTCFIVEVSPQLTNTYGATLTDVNGCTVSDLVTIFVRKDRDVFIPNVFSPNQDGNNDLFMIFAGKDVVKVNSFQVFNRWGEPVFQRYDFPANHPAHGWNGWYRGRPCNNAVYVWFAEIEFIDGEVILYKGDVALIR